MLFKHELVKLESGLRLVTVPMAVPSVTVLVLVGVGSRYEAEKTNGVSHFLEHMVFKGTEKYPTALDLSSAVDSVGGEFNAFTGKEHTGFYVKAAGKQVRLAIEVLSQMLFKPRFLAPELEREKGVIIEEINMYEDQPIRDIDNVFDRLLYSPASLGWEVIGTKETIREMKRNDFLEHLETWYRPENMVVGIAGDERRIKYHVSSIRQLVEEQFKRANGKWQTANSRRKWEKFEQKKPQVKIKHKQTEQAHFIVGVRGLPRGHKDRYGLAVLSTILGGNMSSRLFIEVRERRGLAYYVRSLVDMYHGAGHLGVQAGVELGRVEEAIKVILEELAKVRQGQGKGKVDEAEMAKAKDYLKGRLMLDLEEGREVAGEYGESWLLEGKIRTPEEIIAGVDQVTLAQVRRLSGELLVGQYLNLAIIGPYKDEGGFEKLLKL